MRFFCYLLKEDRQLCCL